MSNRSDVPQRFFQIVSLSLGHDVRLSLPRSFISRSGHNLSDTVRLVGSDGIICTIQLERTDGSIYLAGGWPGFFDHHNLQDGYVIVFEYDGNATFDVSIFDHFGVEVTYESDESHIELSEIGNPIFRVTLDANRDGHRKIYVPGAFARLYLPTFVQNVQIHDSLHHNWPLQTNLRTNGCVRCFTIGWADYVREKQLEIGNTCVFELLDNEMPMFLVYKVSHIDQSLTLA